jgi:hypothetical protein
MNSMVQEVERLGNEVKEYEHMASEVMESRAMMDSIVCIMGNVFSWTFFFP